MRQRTPVALLVALAAATSTFAAGPYKVYRVGSAAAALSAPAPLMTVVSAGTVSDPSLGDGNTYYYFVRDGSGASLDLGMGGDRVAGTVLITFTGTGNLHDDALGSASTCSARPVSWPPWKPPLPARRWPIFSTRRA